MFLYNELKVCVKANFAQFTNTYGGRWKQDSTNNPDITNTVNLQDSNNKRTEIWKDVEAETLQDQEIWSMLRPRPAETEQKLSRPRLVVDVNVKVYMAWANFPHNSWIFHLGKMYL